VDFFSIVVRLFFALAFLGIIYYLYKAYVNTTKGAEPRTPTPPVQAYTAPSPERDNQAKAVPDNVMATLLPRYMQKLEPSVAALAQFFHEFSRYSGVGHKLSQHIGQADGNGLIDTLATVFLTDVAYISRKLGHPVCKNNPESCGFVSLMLQLRSSTDDETDWNRKTIQLFANKKVNLDVIVADLDNNHAALRQSSEYFLFNHLFKDFSPDATKKYMRLMYNFSAALANIDGRLTIAEIQWLQFMEKLIGLSSTSNPSRATRQTLSPEAIMKASQKYTGPIPVTVAKVSAATAESQDSEDAEKELDDLIGLSSVKQEVITFRNFLKIMSERKKKGLSVPPTSYHLVFSGNPGTGKTTIARIMAQILKNLGVVSSGHLVEASRSELVAGYMGQTAIKTNKVIDSALDGVLFIDEAYTLSRNSENDFGQEAIDTLLKRMEDDRDRLVVIIAGYTDEIKKFVSSNPGLSSRFNRYIHFPDYTETELEEIFELLASKYDYVMNDSARTALRKAIAKAVSEKDSHFGNGRFVRNLFEKTIEHQANRLAKVENLGQVNISEIDGADI